MTSKDTGAARDRRTKKVLEGMLSEALQRNTDLRRRLYEAGGRIKQAEEQRATIERLSHDKTRAEERVEALLAALVNMQQDNRRLQLQSGWVAKQGDREYWAKLGRQFRDIVPTLSPAAMVSVDTETPGCNAKAESPDA